MTRYWVYRLTPPGRPQKSRLTTKRRRGHNFLMIPQISSRGMNHRKITRPTHTLTHSRLDNQSPILKPERLCAPQERRERSHTHTHKQRREAAAGPSQPAEPSNKRIMGGQEEAGSAQVEWWEGISREKIMARGDGEAAHSLEQTDSTQVRCCCSQVDDAGSVSRPASLASNL